MIIPVREVIFPPGNAVPLYNLTAVLNIAYSSIIYSRSHKHIHHCSFSCIALATAMVKLLGANKASMIGAISVLLSSDPLQKTSCSTYVSQPLSLEQASYSKWPSKIFVI